MFRSVFIRGGYVCCRHGGCSKRGWRSFLAYSQATPAPDPSVATPHLGLIMPIGADVTARTTMLSSTDITK